MDKQPEEFLSIQNELEKINQKILKALDQINDTIFDVKIEFRKICKNSNSVKELEYMKLHIDIRLKKLRDMLLEMDIEYEKSICEICEKGGVKDEQ